MPSPPLLISPIDPRSPDAAALIALLSQDLARRYDFVSDGSGAFRPEDVLVPRATFLVGRVPLEHASTCPLAPASPNSPRDIAPASASRSRVIAAAPASSSCDIAPASPPHDAAGSPDALAVACGAYRPFGPDEPHVAEVKRMYVRPEFRGRGYSAAILAELERRAALDAYRTIRLETGNRQPEAIRLYESRGYRRIENFGRYVGHIEHQCYEKIMA